MGAFVRFVAYAAVALSVSGCDPVLERRYITEGAGIDLYTPDRANQIELLNEYINFVCAQEGKGPSCDGNWTLFVQAGMNDIDLRCDGFLTWIDARRRDKEPVLAEISAINTAVHTVMTVTGSSPDALNIVTAAFGLASASYTNWNSRLLISVNQSTIQDVVYTSQGKFRDKIKDYRVPDQPAAIYLLRNYLRLCMPTTIEAAINTTTSLVQRGNPMAAQANLVVTNTIRSPSVVGGATVMRARFEPDDASAILEKFLDPDGTGVRRPDRVEAVTPFLTSRGLRVPRDLTRFLNESEFRKQRRDLVKELKDQRKL
jgi:hypothetical protein